MASLSTERTADEGSSRATRISRHSRVYVFALLEGRRFQLLGTSIRGIIFNGPPWSVRSWTKSQDQTWLRPVALGGDPVETPWRCLHFFGGFTCKPFLNVVVPEQTSCLLSSLPSPARHGCADNRSGDVPRTALQSARPTAELSYWPAWARVAVRWPTEAEIGTSPLKRVQPSLSRIFYCSFLLLGAHHFFDNVSSITWFLSLWSASSFFNSVFSFSSSL